MIELVADLVPSTRTLDDRMSAPITAGVELDDAPVDISGYAVTAAFLPPHGDPHPLDVAIEDAAVGQIVITPPPPGVLLDLAGSWQLVAWLVTADERIALAPSRLYVINPAALWMPPRVIRDRWRDAPADDAQLIDLMLVAQEQVSEYGPRRIRMGLVEGALPPDRYARAALMQARNLWNAAKTDPGGAIGAEPGGFAFTPFPLDWQVRQTIRPKTGKPVIR